jgi:hypothetical protein
MNISRWVLECRPMSGIPAGLDCADFHSAWAVRKRAFSNLVFSK